ncbi:MAG TPA: DUF1801 domain-containing protein [Candidatus Baltobacteraceae bacterium]|nr:DUF1801 domain-containing protein [Candidatus Baltobacteraceae bacterium]
MSEAAARDFEDYAGRFPSETQRLLRRVRATIRKAAPEATEAISYRMPAFKLDRILVWYAACAHHIGFYPGASGIAAFKKELSPYRFAKGTVQFPFGEPLPLALISRMVKFRVAEQRAKRS